MQRILILIVEAPITNPSGNLIDPLKGAPYSNHPGPLQKSFPAAGIAAGLVVLVASLVEGLEPISMQAMNNYCSYY